MRGGLGLAAVLATVVTALVLGGAGAAASSQSVHSAIGLPLIGSSHSMAGQSAGNGATLNATAANSSQASNGNSNGNSSKEKAGGGGDGGEKVCENDDHEKGTPPRENKPKNCEGDGKGKSGD